MTNNNLLMYGAIAVGAIYLYNRYTKKETPKEEPNGGGGGGGGFFPPMPPTPNPNLVIQDIPRGGIVTPTTPTNPVVLSGLGGAKPVVTASTSSTGVGATTNAPSNTGITGIGTPTSSTTTQGGNIFQPFDGYNFNGGLSLDQIRRSWNRP
jgi:hypothetical protein